MSIYLPMLPIYLRPLTYLCTTNLTMSTYQCPFTYLCYLPMLPTYWCPPTYVQLCPLNNLCHLPTYFPLPTFLIFLIEKNFCRPGFEPGSSATANHLSFHETLGVKPRWSIEAQLAEWSLLIAEFSISNPDSSFPWHIQTLFVQLFW